MSETIYRTALQSVETDTENLEAKALLEKAQSLYGMIPNMFANMANMPGLLETYMGGYTKLHIQSGFTPAELDVVFLTTSRKNECEYCVGAHSFSADYVSNVPKDVTDAIRDNKNIPDKKLRALSEFTLVMMNKMGAPSTDDVAKFKSAGFTDNHILSIILAISIKTISNYINHIFATPLDQMMTPRIWKSKLNL